MELSLRWRDAWHSAGFVVGQLQDANAERLPFFMDAFYGSGHGEALFRRWAPPEGRILAEG